MPECWIGIIFPINAKGPEGFEYVDIEPLNDAVFYLKDKRSIED